MNHFTKNYTLELSLNQALDLGVQSLKKITKQKFNPQMVEAAVIDEKNGYQKLTQESIQNLVEKQGLEEKQ
jgi:20S proteasome alpha/beta subunit